MPSASRRPVVLYLINGFNRGGAEKGLLHLMRNGAFSGCDLHLVSIIAGQGAYVAELRQAGASVEHLSPGAGMSILDWLRAVPRFWSRMRRLKPDVILLSLPQANIAGRVAALFYRRGIVASFEHNTHLAKPLYETLFRLTSGRVNWMLADCQTTADEAAERLYTRPPGQVIVLPLVSFAPDAVAPASRPVRPPDQPFTLLSAGRFTPVKNQMAMIEAVATLRQRGRIVRLVLFGEGEGMPACQARADALGVAGQVVFAGYSPTWMETPADAFLLASRHEGLCIVALEAMAAGMPVIAPMVGGLRDYGPRARILPVDPARPDDIPDAITRLMDDPGLGDAMRAAGREVVTGPFSNAAIADIYGALAGRIAATATQQEAGSARPAAL